MGDSLQGKDKFAVSINKININFGSESDDDYQKEKIHTKLIDQNSKKFGLIKDQKINIEECFDSQLDDLSFSKVFLQGKTNQQICLKIHDDQIIFYDKDTDMLKKINPLVQEKDEQGLRICKQIILQKPLSEICPQVEKDDKVSIVSCTLDKKYILLGTFQGTVIILDSDNFQTFQFFKNMTRVTSLSGNEQIIVSVHQDGQIMQYKKEISTFDTELSKITHVCIKKAGDSIYSLKISPYSDHLVIVDDSFQGTLYCGTQKKKVEEIGDTFDFTPDCLFTVDQSLQNVEIICLKTYQIIRHIDQVLNGESIWFLKEDKSNECIIIANLNNICLLDYAGNQLKKTVKHQNLLLYVNRSFLNLKYLDGTIICKQQIDQDLKLDQFLLIPHEEQFVLSFDQQEEAFLIEIFDNELSYIHDYKLPFLKPDEKIFCFQNDQDTNFVNIDTFENQQTIEGFQLLGFSEDRKKSGSVLKKNGTIVIQKKGIEQKNNLVTQQKVDAASAKKEVKEQKNDKVVQPKVDENMKKQDDVKQKPNSVVLLKQVDASEAKDDGTSFIYFGNKDVFGNGFRAKKFIMIDSSNHEKTIFEKEVHNFQINSQLQLIYFTDNKTLYEYDLLSQQVTKQKTFNWINSMKLSPKQNFLIISNEKQFTIISNLQYKKEKEFTINKQREDELTEQKVLDITKDGKYFICGSYCTSDLVIYSTQTQLKITSIEAHKNTDVLCYFIDNNQAITMSYDKTKHNQFNFNLPAQLFCWNISNISNWQKLFEINHCIIVPIIGYNSQLTGMVINGKVRTLSEALIELTSNLAHFQFIPFKKQTVQGPIPSKFFFKSMKIYLKLQDKIQRDCYTQNLAQQIVNPYGFTLLSYLIIKNKTQIIEEVLNFEETLFVRDYLGNSPLTYALKNKNHYVINLIIDYIINKKVEFISLINIEELVLLLRQAPVGLQSLFQKCVIEVETKFVFEQVLGSSKSYQLVNPDYLMFQKFKEILAAKIAGQNSDIEGNKPVVIKRTLIPLNLSKGSFESLVLIKGIESCDDQEICNSEFIKNVIQYKWQEIQYVNIFLLTVQSVQTIFFIVFAKNNSDFLTINLIWLSVCYQLIREFIIFYRVGIATQNFAKQSILANIIQALRFNNKIAILVILLQIIYCFYLILDIQTGLDTIFQIIAILSQILLLIELEHFEIVRKFNIIIINCAKCLIGFMVYFLFILLIFSSNQHLLDWNQNGLKIDNQQQDLYQEHNNEEISNNQKDRFKFTLLSMIPNEQNSSFLSFTLLITIAFNIIFLNLIIAMVVESYQQTINFIDYNSLKQKIHTMLRNEALLQPSKQIKDLSCLVWMQYIGSIQSIFKSQSHLIISNVQNMLDQKFSQVLVNSNIKQVELNKKLSDFSSEIKSDISELRQKMSDQDQKLTFIYEFLIKNDMTAKGKPEENKPVQSTKAVESSATNKPEEVKQKTEPVAKVETTVKKLEPVAKVETTVKKLEDVGKVDTTVKKLEPVAKVETTFKKLEDVGKVDTTVKKPEETKQKSDPVLQENGKNQKQETSQKQDQTNQQKK